MSFRSSAAVATLVACAACAQTTGNPIENTPPYSPPPTASQPESVAVNTQKPGTLPVGQELDVRLQSTLSSATATVEQRFEATTVVDLMQGGKVLVPAGTTVRGIVSGVDKAGRLERTGRLTLSFDQMVVDGREIPMRATATQVFESGGIREEGGTAATGAVGGGLIGGIIGGLRGALLGAVIGAGGAIVATEGKDVTLPAGTVVRIRMDQPVQIHS